MAFVIFGRQRCSGKEPTATIRANGYLYVSDDSLSSLGFERKDCKFHQLWFDEETRRAGIRFFQDPPSSEYTRHSLDEPAGIVFLIAPFLRYHELRRGGVQILTLSMENSMVVTSPLEAKRK